MPKSHLLLLTIKKKHLQEQAISHIQVIQSAASMKNLESQGAEGSFVFLKLLCVDHTFSMATTHHKPVHSKVNIY